MSKTTNKFSPEFRERAVRMVDERSSRVRKMVSANFGAPIQVCVVLR
jgi:transposase-like protein